MDDQLTCPSCQALLVLPSVAAGQTVQCPRCQRAFTPGERPVSAITTTAPIPIGPASSAEDHELFEQMPILVPLHPPAGAWFAIVTMLLLAANVIPFSMWAYSWIEMAEIMAPGPAAFRGGKARFHPEIAHQAEAWAPITFLPAVLAFVIWSLLAARNARRLQATRFLPWKSLVIGILFIPCANVFIAYINLQEIWRASDPYEIDEPDSWRRVPASWLIRVWGLLLLLAPLLLFATFQIDKAPGNHGQIIPLMAVVVNLLIVAANILLIAIIRNITVRQRQRYTRLYEDPAVS